MTASCAAPTADRAPRTASRLHLGDQLLHVGQQPRDVAPHALGVRMNPVRLVQRALGRDALEEEWIEDDPGPLPSWVNTALNASAYSCPRLGGASIPVSNTGIFLAASVSKIADKLACMSAGGSAGRAARHSPPTPRRPHPRRRPAPNPAAPGRPRSCRRKRRRRPSSHCSPWPSAPPSFAPGTLQTAAGRSRRLGCRRGSGSAPAWRRPPQCTKPRTPREPRWPETAERHMRSSWT